MAYKRKTWKEKMGTGTEKATVVKVEKKFADVPAGATMVIATPTIVDDYIRHIPKGKETTLQQMRRDLAAQYHTEYTCPVTSGIFLRIVSEAAFDEYRAGTPVSKITPFWRMIDSKSPAIKKLTFGADFVRQQRKKEGLSF